MNKTQQIFDKLKSYLTPQEYNEIILIIKNNDICVKKIVEKYDFDSGFPKIMKSKMSDNIYLIFKITVIGQGLGFLIKRTIDRIYIFFEYNSDWNAINFEEI
jgi:hypothetical protein